MGLSRQEYWSGLPCSSRGSSQLRDQTQVDSLTYEPSGKPKNTGVGSLALLQGIFLTQESNQGLLHYRQILYQLSYQGSPRYKRWFMGKESACNAEDQEDAGSIPGSGRSPAGGNSHPLQYSCLENPMDRAAWRATVHRAANSWTRLKRLSTQRGICIVLCSAPGTVLGTYHRRST